MKSSIFNLSSTFGDDKKRIESDELSSLLSKMYISNQKRLSDKDIDSLDSDLSSLTLSDKKVIDSLGSDFSSLLLSNNKKVVESDIDSLGSDLSSLSLSNKSKNTNSTNSTNSANSVKGIKNDDETSLLSKMFISKQNQSSDSVSDLSKKLNIAPSVSESEVPIKQRLRKIIRKPIYSLGKKKSKSVTREEWKSAVENK